MDSPAVTFDLRGPASRGLRYRRGSFIAVWLTFLWFLALGLGLIYWGSTHTIGAAVWGCGIGLVAAGIAMLVVVAMGTRFATEARVGRDEITWVPSRGRPSTTRWDDPRLRILIVDWRANQLRPPLLRGPDDLAVVGSGFFAKYVTAPCFEAILSSARSRGLHIDEGVRQPGTKYERRVIVITKSA